MHPSALKTGKLFFDTYATRLPPGSVALDIGSQNVNGSLKDVCPAHLKYVGIDFSPGNGVDVVLDDPYKFPFEDQSADVAVCSSCFEHSEMFWLLFLEILRVLKPAGLLYLNVPSNGYFHRYPVDCWRFYPDSGGALVRWAKRNGYDPLLLESFTGRQDQDVWNDFVAVFLKSAAAAPSHPARMLASNGNVTNAIVHGTDGVLNPHGMPEDLEKLAVIQQVANGTMKVNLTSQG